MACASGAGAELAGSWARPQLDSCRCSCGARHALAGRPRTWALSPAAAERPAQRLRAEQQWDIATEFDQRYSDPAWVSANKHWPPRLMAALHRFLALQ